MLSPFAGSPSGEEEEEEIDDSGEVIADDDQSVDESQVKLDIPVDVHQPPKGLS